MAQNRIAPGYLVSGPAERACLAIPARLKIDFVYIDPPFGVGTLMSARAEKGQARGRRQAKSGPAAYLDGANITELVRMVAASLHALKARLRPGATVAVHLDHRAVHDAKVAIDDVFGRGAFLGEIIWVPGNGGRGKKFQVTHQTILLYTTRSSDRGLVTYRVDDPALREPYAQTSLSMHFRHVDENGRRYRERTINGATYRYYADEGRRLGSVWSDIPAMTANTPIRSEGTGYPTQKPEKLLERLILATTEPGMLVADFMCGSGTTLAVAHRLKRRFVGGDVGQLAIETTERRLKKQGATFRRITAEP